MIEPNIIKLPTSVNIKFQDISKDNVLAKMAQETQTMAPSYEQNEAKIGEIHGTVNLRFKRPVHKGYMEEVVVGGGGRGKDKPQSPLMISVQKVRMRPGKGKGKSDGWFP